MKPGIFILALLVVFFQNACQSSLPVPPSEIIDNSGEYTRSITVETSPAFEIFNIAIALTDFGMKSGHYVKKDTPYYSEMYAAFSGLQSHPFIKLIEEFCSQNPAQTPVMDENYNNIKEASFYFNFNGSGFDVKEGAAELLPGEYMYLIDLMEEHVNTFARDSVFFAFYEKHARVYRDMAASYKRALPARTMWEWLEKRFPVTYDQYYIALSPLTGGSHCRFQQKLTPEKIIVMIVPNPPSRLTTKTEEGWNSVYLFTEIDHEYTNPVSDIYADAIKDAFSDISRWNNEVGYGSPLATFNEYMTWGIFTLYAYDSYSPDDFTTIKHRTVTIMEKDRKFVRFGEFNEALLGFYKESKEGESLSSLFPKIIQWSKDRK